MHFSFFNLLEDFSLPNGMLGFSRVVPAWSSESAEILPHLPGITFVVSFKAVLTFVVLVWCIKRLV